MTLTNGCTLLTIKHWGQLKEILLGGTIFEWQSFTSVSLKLWYLFWCCCCPGFHVCCEWFSDGTILKFCPPPPLPLFCWSPSRGPLGKGYCLFVIAEKISLGFCFLLAVLMISDSNLSPKLCFLKKNLIFFFKELFHFPGISSNFFRGLKRLVYEILLKS